MTYAAQTLPLIRHPARNRLPRDLLSAPCLLMKASFETHRVEI
jgi:hypothetical protein